MPNCLCQYLSTVFLAGTIAIAHETTAEDAAFLLVQQQGRAVETIDNFEVSHQVDITRNTPRFKQTTHSYINTWISRPAHIRVESQHRGQRMTIVSTGVATWFYNGADQKYSKQLAPAPGALFANAFPGLSRQLSDANLPGEITSAKIVMSEPLHVAGRSFVCDVVEVTVRPAVANGTLQNSSLRLWISRAYKVPLKVQATFLSPAGGTAQEYVDYVTNFQPNLNIPKSTWEFQPPPGATPN